MRPTTVTILLAALWFSLAPVRAAAAIPAPLRHTGDEHTFPLQIVTHWPRHHHWGHGSFHWVRRAIVHIFDGYAYQAFRVARCESNYNVDARRGRFYGLFQLGDTERATYGNGIHAWGETAAAHRYFKAAGGWGPWSCQP